jgi:hypothetical protein
MHPSQMLDMYASNPDVGHVCIQSTCCGLDHLSPVLLQRGMGGQAHSACAPGAVTETSRSMSHLLALLCMLPTAVNPTHQLAHCPVCLAGLQHSSLIGEGLRQWYLLVWVSGPALLYDTLF